MLICKTKLTFTLISITKYTKYINYILIFISDSGYEAKLSIPSYKFDFFFLKKKREEILIKFSLISILFIDVSIDQDGDLGGLF